MKVAVALIVAAGLSTMAYALPEQRAMAHHLISSDPSDASDADVIPFGPNSPDPSVSANKSDPPPTPDPPGGNGNGNGGGGFGPNCVGCISTQNLANGAVTNPKLAPGSVTSSDIGAGQVMTPNIADHNITSSKIAPGVVVNPTFYEIPAGHDGWVPGTGNVNMVVQGPDLGAINSKSTVLLSLGGGNTGPAVCGAYNTFTTI